jgi:hypothetical protein
MWKRIARPDVLIFLDVSYVVSIRRKILNWTHADYLEQQHRLRDARQNAHLVIDTDPLTPDEVLDHVLSYLGALPEFHNNNPRNTNL